uniref:Uncharacterized protein n=1 Tax=Heterorhabditis bacteriophora TaxID=37862 RepID=A0A1I7X2K2_HETBA
MVRFLHEQLDITISETYTVRFKMIAHFVFLPFFCSLWGVRALKISSFNFIAFHKKYHFYANFSQNHHFSSFQNDSTLPIFWALFNEKNAN